MSGMKQVLSLKPISEKLQKATKIYGSAGMGKLIWDCDFKFV